MTPERPWTDDSLRQRRTDALVGAFLTLCAALILWLGLCLVLRPEAPPEPVWAPAGAEGER